MFFVVQSTGSEPLYTIAVSMGTRYPVIEA